MTTIPRAHLNFFAVLPELLIWHMFQWISPEEQSLVFTRVSRAVSRCLDNKRERQLRAIELNFPMGRSFNPLVVTQGDPELFYSIPYIDFGRALTPTYLRRLCFLMEQQEIPVARTHAEWKEVDPVSGKERAYYTERPVLVVHHTQRGGSLFLMGKELTVSWSKQQLFISPMVASEKAVCQLVARGGWIPKLRDPRTTREVSLSREASPQLKYRPSPALVAAAEAALVSI